MQALQTENDTLNQELQGYVGTDGTLQTIDSLLAAATTYLETQDITQTAANLESISASVDVDSTSEAFQKLYKTLLGLIGPQLSAQYYETGYNAYRSEDYATAIENLSKAVIYDETNKDAWLSLGNSYRKSDDAQNAITTYDKIIELFPDTETAQKCPEISFPAGREYGTVGKNNIPSDNDTQHTKENLRKVKRGFSFLLSKNAGKQRNVRKYGRLSDH